jgi:ABC-2 type transport system ATP-binding protein
MSEQLFVETQGASFHYGQRPVLHELSLRVPAGSIYGFLGPNGAGKSTSLRLLLGLLQPSAGRVALFGHDLRRDRAAALRRVGALIEMPSLYDHLSGHDNLEATRRLHGLPAHRTAEVLRIVGLAHDAGRPAREYSLGMRQRLGLALALLPDPDLLILDEPTNGLDPQGIAEMRQLILRLQSEFGKTILLSSHLLPEIERMATHVGVIQGGRLLFQGALAELQLRQTTQARIVIETDDAVACRARLPEALREAVATDATRLTLPFRSRQQLAQLAQLLATAGLPLYGLSCQQPTLEETFLHLTETAPAR